MDKEFKVLLALGAFWMLAVISSIGAALFIAGRYLGVF